MAKKTEQLPQLEASLTELSELIDKMEHGELSLEQALTQFERGIHLIRHCQKTLQEAEQKVQILIGNSPNDSLTAYDQGSDEHDNHN
ncbi:MAG: exodeoxyribonuclease VII small subunit [Gammaproteobacteria bacterium RIFCSPHIGHO2_12_FULL_45_12]|nr:MAG: exodeoxyribonuclease VII small subunit [Gammaproteobacteria bacterium RIFCSPHIGHO2_12_FULL_45_12]